MFWVYALHEDLSDRSHPHYKGIAEIDNQRCVDCGNCLRACPVDAFYVEQDDLSKIMVTNTG